MKNAFFTPEELSLLDGEQLPRHVAIVPDGNRRWAKEHHSPRDMGHHQGANVVLDIVKAAKELRIKTITFYTFSTENWNREQTEIDAIFFLLEHFLITQRQKMLDNGVKLGHIGDLTPLPNHLKQVLAKTAAATAHCQDINFVMALNYGGRDEIRRAVQKLLKEKRTAEEITEELLSKQLDTVPYGDPELLIRTSGEQRISNFMLWQTSYTEMVIYKELWPDFTPHHLYNAVREYQSRHRRVGA